LLAASLAPSPVILAVAIDTPLRRLFDYLPPPHVDVSSLRPGQRLWVPFGRRRVVGVLMQLRAQSDLPPDKLRAALDVIDEEPTFDRTLLDVLGWAAEYYHHPVGAVVAAALPMLLRSGAPVSAVMRVWRLTDSGRSESPPLPVRAARLRAAINYLKTRDTAETSELLEAGATGPALKKLQERGYIEQLVVRHEPMEARTVGVQPGPTLNAAQAAAVDAIRASLERFKSFLLHGVTGSGKTEVYLHSIATVLARGAQALVLVPEIALTPQLIGRFRNRFDTPMAVLHSGLNDTERLAAWRSARSGEARIVIGTRSAVFVPLARPGLIVVDEEHDPSFKQQEGFRYSARDLAIVRAQRHDIPIVLGSATPSLESLARAQRQPETLLTLPHRAADAKPPRTALVDLRSHGAAQGIATPVLTAMRRHLDAGNQILLFLNRRGYAPVLFCPKCGWSAHCRRCDAHLTVHGKSKELACHHCGAQQPTPPECPSCEAALKPVGQGTERIEETVAQLFPDAPLARIDRDSMRRKGELEETLARVDRKEVRILIGTQMLTKGHHFSNVTLVVVLNADQGLFSTDFRASERLAQTIVQVAGRAGRAEHPGEVLIQTEYPEHALLKRLLEGGYESFASGALLEREQAKWPPFARIALIRAEAAQPSVAMQFLRSARDAARAHAAKDVEILGPAPAPMERRAGRYRAQLLLHADTHSPLQKFLRAWLPAIEAMPDAKRVRWAVDVDPVDLM
jgi:primosomal protein N' (replication factor Y)